MTGLIRLQKVSQGESPGKLTLESTMKEGFLKKMLGSVHRESKRRRVGLSKKAAEPLVQSKHRLRLGVCS